MKTKQIVLIENLLEYTEQALKDVKAFKELPQADLNRKINPNSWSVLECIEHLNLYGNFYLPEIDNRISNATTVSQSIVFKSGMLGDYFVKIIRPESKKKMKAVKSMDTTGSQLNFTTIDQFIKQLEELKRLLIASKNVDLTKVKTAISLTTLVKLRLGDTFRFLIYHNQRHIQQAQRVAEHFRTVAHN